MSQFSIFLHGDRENTCQMDRNFVFSSREKQGTQQKNDLYEFADDTIPCLELVVFVCQLLHNLQKFRLCPFFLYI